MNNRSDTLLGTEKIPKLILSLSVPSIVAQLINVLYNIVDRIYIGHIENFGKIALTGVGLVFPLITIISAFSCLVGIGGAPLAAIKLGEKDYDGAERIINCSFTMLLCISAVLTVLFIVFAKPLLYLFGASNESISYALDYALIYVCGTVFVQLSLGLNTFISCQGRAKMAMTTVLIGALCNILLDTIFINILCMGVRGAALATVISQMLSAVWVLKFLMSEKSVIRIRLSKLGINKKILLSIVSLGISPFIMQSTESLVSITLNSGLQKYGGDIYVGTMTILTSLLQLVLIPMNGFSQGVQPIISYNYGAGNSGRVKKCFRIMVVVSVTLSFSSYILICLFSKQFASIFTTDAELINLTSGIIPFFLAGMTIFGLQNACQATFIGLGEAKMSIICALLRKIILLIPLAIVFPLIFGTAESIYFAEPVADALAAAITFALFCLNINKILKYE